MKLPVLLALVAVCAGSALPGVPGDNSAYKPGDRYVWMPDGRGIPHLVDLEAPVEKLPLKTTKNDGTKYLLYTRSNPSFPQELTSGDADSVRNSNIRFNRTVNVVVHGWNGDGSSDINTFCVTAFLANDDDNVIVMDWGHLANGLYVTATAYTPGLGMELGTFLRFLNSLGVPYANMHLVGFSLGAHLVGVAGRSLGGQVARVTGLEPAGPGWGESNPFTLHVNDGVYVETIHTDSNTLGMWNDLGDAAFYPNGGSSQPGCWLSTCSHSRSWALFASSVTTNHLWGRQCTSLLQVQSGTCTGLTFPMGNGIITKRGYGMYFVLTTSTWPF